MGALTLKTFSDESREWELFESESVDITDGFGSSLRVSVRENKIMLVEPYDPVLPWLTDRGRLFFEGQAVSGASGVNIWEFAVKNLQAAVYFADHLAFIGVRSTDVASNITVVFRQLDLDSANVLVWLEEKFTFLNLRRDESFYSNVDLEHNYLLTPRLELTQLSFSSLAVLLGINLRYEGSRLNLLFRQRFLKGGFQVVRLGPDIADTLTTNSVGWCLRSFKQMAEGVSPVCRAVSNAALPIFVSSYRSCRSPGFAAIQKMVSVIDSSCRSLGGLSLVSDRIESAGINHLGRFKHLTKTDIDSSSVMCYFNAKLEDNGVVKKIFDRLSVQSYPIDQAVTQMVLEHSVECDGTRRDVLKGVDAISYAHLPAKTFFEQNSSYLNAEGEPRISARVLRSCQNKKSDWAALRQIGFVLEKLKPVSDKRSCFFIGKISGILSKQKSYFLFTTTATQSLTSGAFNAKFSRNPEHYHRTKKFSAIFKNQTASFKDLYIKPWLDDFFVGGTKDSYSPKSSTLIKCSSLCRLSNTNFF